ncbi:MAG: hypothetical protein WC178_04805 [Candidatus Paceibacterota bacterium]
MKKVLDLKNGQDKDSISDDIFVREIAMCKKLNGKNGGKCNWGECKNCGVIPLLYKLHEGKFLEKEEEIEKIKAELFSDKQ